MPNDASRVESLTVLSRFRTDFYACLTARVDALFELTDALLCTEGPVRTLVGLSLAPEHRRGHGAMYDGLNKGWIQVSRLRTVLAQLPLPRLHGRLVLAVDVSAWLRPDAAASADRLFCHVYGRGRNQAQLIPGWPYSFIAALEPGRTSWTAILDAIRLGPADDVAEVTAIQIRGVIERLIGARHWTPGDPDVLVVFDAGYDVTRLAFLLADLPVEVLGRLRTDRVLRLPTPPRSPTTIGRPPKHGVEFRLADPTTWPTPAVTTSTATSRYGTANTSAWDHVHPKLTRRAAWIDHDADLPVLPGTLIRLQVEHLPGDRDPKPLWLWSSRTGAVPDDVDRLWQAFLRRFDLEHTFRMFKQTLGWTTPRLRDPAAADRWTWLVITAYTQLRLARHLTDDLRRPWEPPARQDRLTPRGSAAGFATSTRKPPIPPVHRNPAHPAPDDLEAPKTITERPTPTSAKPPKGT